MLVEQPVVSSTVRYKLGAVVRMCTCCNNHALSQENGLLRSLRGDSEGLAPQRQPLAGTNSAEEPINVAQVVSPLSGLPGTTL
jgi:hypothetical protein